MGSYPVRASDLGRRLAQRREGPDAAPRPSPVRRRIQPRLLSCPRRWMDFERWMWMVWYLLGAASVIR